MNAAGALAPIGPDGGGLDGAAMVGFAGTILIVGAYFYLTASARPNPWLLHGANLAGASLLTVSLLVHTNWPSLVLEGFWASIAAWGLWKAWRGRAAAGAPEETPPQALVHTQAQAQVHTQAQPEEQARS